MNKQIQKLKTRKTMLLFSIQYQLKVASHNHGEYSKQISTRVEKMTSTSNYLPDIMADIYDKHRSDWLMGVEIQEVQPLHEATMAYVSEHSIRTLNQFQM
ncbi:MAG: hypothetical protein H7259_06970 [Cytophagales bacterium]|nr:hypothetical protein [Cytophaga sp.]